MRSYLLALCLGVLLAMGRSPASAQTAGIQQKLAADNEKKKAENALAEQQLNLSLEQALKNNPDIRVAESKLREAEAELDRTRATTMHKLVALRAAMRSAKAELDEADSRYKRSKELNSQGVLSSEELGQAALGLMNAKEKGERLEAEQQYLLGKAPTATFTMTIGGLPKLAAGYNKAFTGYRSVHDYGSKLPQGKTDKLRSLLQVRATWQNRDLTDLRLLADALMSHLPGFEIQVMVDRDGRVKPQSFAGPVFSDKMPLFAIIQWIEDRYEVRFVVRDYGIVVTDRNRVPPGGVALLELASDPMPPPSPAAGKATDAPKSEPRP